MSEYQYYDFRALDRPLNRQEIDEVASYSSRADPSSTRVTFEYHYSDFRYDEEQVLCDFFDVMLYVANWGTRRLLMKFPAELVAYEELKAYEIDASHDFIQEVKVSPKESFVLVNLQYSDEEGYWIEGEGMLDALLPIRQQILDGDYRALFLAWLHLASIHPDLEPSQETPPIPANLQKMDYTLNQFIDFWEIDIDLLASVADYSQSEKLISDQDLIQQIPLLSEAEKEQYLEAFLTQGKAKHELRKRLKELYLKDKADIQSEAITLAEIQEGTAQKHKTRIEEEKRAAEVAWKQKMEKIAAQEADLWKEVWANADLKTATGYKEAVSMICDLKDYTQYAGKQKRFEAKIHNLLLRFHSQALRRRLKENNIL